MFANDPLKYFQPVLKASELKKAPVRVIIGDRAFVLFREANGSAAALEDRCAHRLARLSGGTVREGRIHCPYHDWNFGADGKGKCPSQPGLKVATVPHFQVVEKYQFLWLGNNDVSVEQLPVLANPEFTQTDSFSVFFKAPLHVVLANFSEDEHLPYVHNILGWDEENWSKVHFQAENYPDRTEVKYSGPQKHSSLNFSLGVKRGDIFHNSWATRFDPLCAIFDMHWTDSSGTKNRPWIFRSPIYMVPEGQSATRMHVFSFAKIESKRLAWLLPVVTPLLRRNGRREIQADANFMHHIADTPDEMRGMCLGRFDKPLLHNQKLLRRIYFGHDDKPDGGRLSNPGGPETSTT
jgi:phenylpropionate dioxygenase-like ring-hydroxylating dioxygenase large terminal subunit